MAGSLLCIVPVAVCGDWGHSRAWPAGAELSADALWLETLSATGHGDARAFLEWRLRHGLSLSKAADALRVSRRMVAYYSNGAKKVPKPFCWLAGAGKSAMGCTGGGVVIDDGGKCRV